MATAVETIIATPHEHPLQLVNRRATCKGIQYTIADVLGVEIVTVNNGCIGCTCGLDKVFATCQHILLVEKMEAEYTEEAAKRDAYCSTYNIY